MKRQAKKVSLLSEHHLNAYTVAATAAGVGALCLAPVAEAKIIYTPADVWKMPTNGVLGLDLNHDGIADFEFRNRTQFTTTTSRYFGFLSVVPKSVNQVWNGQPCQSGYVCAEALPKGRKIGPNGQFQAGPAYMFFATRRYVFGQWNTRSGTVDAYLGLRFVFKGAPHFGWARVRVTKNFTHRYFQFTAFLTGYAYETIPGKPIIAGATKGQEEQEGSLGAFAAGAARR